jgi:hypothetical protein
MIIDRLHPFLGQIGYRLAEPTVSCRVRVLSGSPIGLQPT